MRFNHPNSIQVPSFLPEASLQPNRPAVFVTDPSGKMVILDQSLNTQEAYNRDMTELQNRLKTHNWFYRYTNDPVSFNQGYHNEQAILAIVQRRGGVFETIWDTERRRHLSTV